MKQVKASREPVVITQRGRAAAVLLSMEAYERNEHEREILYLLARGEQEIAAGTGFDLEDVLARRLLCLLVVQSEGPVHTIRPNSAPPGSVLPIAR